MAKKKRSKNDEDRPEPYKPKTPDQCIALTSGGSQCKNRAKYGYFCGVHNSDKKPHLKKEAMLQALEASLGVVTEAARMAGIDRKTHYRWLDDDKEYAEAVNEIKTVALDFAETQLFNQIRAMNHVSTIFYLKTRGKDRGYVERQELTGADGEDLHKYTEIMVRPSGDASEED